MKIRPTGEFFPQDEAGYILNPTSWEKVPAAYQSLLTFVSAYCVRALGDKLHSIWLRGSLGRGLAVPGQSDIDVFALLHPPAGERWEAAPFADALQAEIRLKFAVSDPLELMLSAYRPDLAVVRPRMAMVIQTQSLCLWGEDIRPALPKYRPGPEMMLARRWIADDLAEFLARPEPAADHWRTLMKGFLRCGFELVMEREKRFTPDLFLCYQTFSRYYPEKAADMRRALQLFLAPPAGPDHFLPFVRSFGRWLSEAARSGADSMDTTAS